MSQVESNLYAPVKLIRNRELEDAISLGTQTKHLMLGRLALLNFPAEPLSALAIKKNSSCLEIVRLDLSCNFIEFVPSLSFLPALTELWLAHNPLSALPDVSSLTKLEVIDIQSTRIANIPSYVSTLPSLYEIDWRDTPLAGNLKNEHGIDSDPSNSMRDLVFLLQQDFNRHNLESDIKNFFESFYLRKGETLTNIRCAVGAIIDGLRSIVPGIEDLKLFLRRAPSFLPDHIDAVNETFLKKTMADLQTFQRDVRRQRLSADLEISLRNFYFDRIQRENVEHVIRAIYDKVSLLEDMEFLIKYASQVLPPSPEEASNGDLVWSNILRLQADLTSKREASIASLAMSLGHLYPEVTKIELQEKAVEVSKLFRMERFATKKELNVLARLAADTEKIFPPDFASIVLDDIASKVSRSSR